MFFAKKCNENCVFCKKAKSSNCHIGYSIINKCLINLLSYCQVKRGNSFWVGLTIKKEI